MLDIALIFLLQVAAPAPSQQPAPVETEAAEPEKPKVVCTMEPITGTRARKQQVCKTPGYEKGAERYRDMLGAI